MTEHGSGPGLHVLLGDRPGPLATADLGAAYPWPAHGRWVRAMMVASLDGAAVGPDGRSGSLSSPTDRLVMAQVRRFCDAILIGAATFRAERYRPQRPDAATRQARTALGLRPAPVIVLVSRSLDLPWEEDAFRESVEPPLVITAASCPPAALAEAERHAEVVVLPGERAAPTALLAALAERGLHRVVCEGGPHLLAELLAAGLVDELDLALSPLVAGGGQLDLGTPSPRPARFRLTQVIAADDFLFTRYLRTDPVTGAAPLEADA